MISHGEMVALTSLQANHATNRRSTFGEDGNSAVALAKALTLVPQRHTVVATLEGRAALVRGLLSAANRMKIATGLKAGWPLRRIAEHVD